MIMGSFSIELLYSVRKACASVGYLHPGMTTSTPVRDVLCQNRQPAFPTEPMTWNGTPMSARNHVQFPFASIGAAKRGLGAVRINRKPISLAELNVPVAFFAEPIWSDEFLVEVTFGKKFRCPVLFVDKPDDDTIYIG